MLVFINVSGAVDEYKLSTARTKFVDTLHDWCAYCNHWLVIKCACDRTLGSKLFQIVTCDVRLQTLQYSATRLFIMFSFEHLIVVAVKYNNSLWLIFNQAKVVTESSSQASHNILHKQRANQLFANINFYLPIEVTDVGTQCPICRFNQILLIRAVVIYFRLNEV